LSTKICSVWTRSLAFHVNAFWAN